MKKGHNRKCNSPVYAVWDHDKRCYVITSKRNFAFLPGTARTFSTWASAGAAKSAILLMLRREARRNGTTFIRRLADQDRYEVHVMALMYAGLWEE